MTNNFMPDGYDKIKTERNYWRPAQFKEGDNRLRILKRPIAGWLDWKDKKPFRYRPNERPKFSFDSNQPMKPFWALAVWDYARSDVFILEITQATIIKSLENYGKDEDWGDFTGYDIKIRKEGSGKDTNYLVTAMPHKPAPAEAQAAFDKNPFRLEALYEGKDPWTDTYPETASEVNLETGELLEASKGLSEEECALLDSFLVNDKNASASICKRFKIETPYEMKKEDLEGIINWLAQRKEARDAKVGVA